MPAAATRLVGLLARMARGGSGGVRLEWDHPRPDEETVGEPVRLSGWAYAPSGVATVSARINRDEWLTASTGQRRPDVATELGTPEARDSGWSLVVPVASLRTGENRVEVVARAQSGARVTLVRMLRWRYFMKGENRYEQVDLSGERYDPRYPYMNSVAIEHRARYRLAASLARGRRVLDAGCGLGYGAATLAAAGAATVDAIDANGPAIECARRDHGVGVRYTIGDIRELPYDAACFDLAVCFEAIEHVAEHDGVLDELRRVLAPDGLLVISTPNRGRYAADNPWHIKELTTDELTAALRERFTNVRALGQQLHLASLLGDAELHEHADPTAAFDAGVLKLSATSRGEEVYVVALASDAPLPATAPLISIGDPRDHLADAAIEGWRGRALEAEAEAALLRLRMDFARQLGVIPDGEFPDPPAAPSPADAGLALARELIGGPPWMYDWDLGSAGRAPSRAGRASLQEVHQTRLELMTPAVREVLGEAGPDSRVLDLACSEGWFAHRMLELGAGSVIGIDIRDVNVRRARVIRDHLGIDPARLEFHQGDIFALPDLGRFDVVLMLGLVYHLENPVGALRVARALTKSLCVVESQLTEQRTPIMAGNGSPAVLFERPASFAAFLEEDQRENPVASFGGVLSLVPNEAALVSMGRVAGFDDVQIVAAAPDHEAQYVRRMRAVMTARVGRGPAIAPAIDS